MTAPTLVTHGRRPIAAERLALPRAMHLLDIENLTLGVVTASGVRSAWAGYCERVEVKPGDAVIVGCSRRSASTTAFAIPRSARIVIGRARSGATAAALLDDVDVELTARRYGAVVIGSSAAAFTDLAVALGARGCRVAVAFPHGAVLSARLRLGSAEQVEVGQRSWEPAPAC